MVFIMKIKLGTTIFYLETMQWYLRMRWKNFHWPWTSGLALVQLGYAPDDQFSAGKLRFCHTEPIMLTFWWLVDIIWSIHLYLINYFSWCRSKFGSNWLDSKIDLSSSLTFKYVGFRDFSHEHHQMYTAQLRMYTAQLPGAQVTCDYPRAVAGCRPQGHFHRKNAFFR